MAKITNTFYFCTQEFHVIFAKKLLKYGFKPKGFLENRNNKKILNSTFPNVKIYKYHNFLKSNFKFYNFYKNIVPVSILEEMNHYFNEYSKILLRQDTFVPTLSLSNALNVFNSNIHYWYNYFIEQKIQLNIFEEEPHKSTTFLVYKLSQIMNIKTYMPLRTIWQLGIIPISNFENKHNDKNLEKLFLTKRSNKTSAEFKEYINSLNKNYENAVNYHLWNQVKDIYNDKTTNFKYLKKIKSYKNLNYYSSDFKTFFSNLEGSNENYIHYLINKIYKLVYINKLKKNYYYLSRNINLSTENKKYIYFPLQMQPEKSTLPLAGIFEDSLYTVKFLLRHTPNKFKIFIKEHPTHFIYWRNTTNLMWRRHDFYKKLLDLSDRIVLVDYKTDVFELIDNSIFVASVGGTVCWEAAVRGKRSLNFSKIWFDNCHGVSTILNESNIKNFIEKEVYNKKISKTKVVNFAKKIFNLGYNCAHGNPDELEHLNLSPEENAEILKSAFLDYFQIK